MFLTAAFTFHPCGFLSYCGLFRCQIYIYVESKSVSHIPDSRIISGILVKHTGQVVFAYLAAACLGIKLGGCSKILLMIKK
jgi:hypothetical protein